MSKTIKPRVIFAGTAEFAVPALEKLIKIADVCLVMTQPARPAGRGLQETYCPVDLCAQEHHLSILRPLSLKREILENVLQEYECDYLIVAAYGKIIPQWLLDFPKYRSLNIHGSLLPRWRGASPIQHALLAGDVETGVNLMEMTLGMDEGPLLLTKRLLIAPTDTTASLMTKLSHLGATVVTDFLKNPRIKSVPQEGTPLYAPKIEKNMGQIVWTQWSSTYIRRALQAFTPWPGIFSWVNPTNERIKILSLGESMAKESDESGFEGQIKIENKKIFVLCQDQFWLELKEIQIEGKKAIKCSDVLSIKDHWIHSINSLYTPNNG